MKKMAAVLLILTLLATMNAFLFAKDGEDDDPSPSATASASSTASPSTSSPSLSASPSPSSSAVGSDSPSASASAPSASASAPSPSASNPATAALEDRLKTAREDWEGRSAIFARLSALRQSLGDRTTPVVVNGTVIRFDVPPVMRESRLLIPVRAVTTALGALVEWRPESPDIVILTKAVRQADGSSLTVRIVINLKTGVVTKNDAVMILDAKPILLSGRTMVPLRFVAEAFGKHVEYDKIAKGVFIDDSFPPEASSPPGSSASASPSPSP